MAPPRNSRLRIGLVYDLLGTAPARPGAPADADAEYEPEETVRALEQAIRTAGHEPVRLGNPHALLARVAARDLDVDAVWNIAEGFGARNREAWAPVLLEMAQIPALGSDALTLSLSLDKAWCKDVVAASGVPVAPHASVAHPDAIENAGIPEGWPLFVKPRWEGTSKGLSPGSRVEDGPALRAEVARITQTYGQPALVEPFLPGAEYTVTVVGNAPPQALPVLQRALDRETGIGLHAVETPGAPRAYDTPGALSEAVETELAGFARTAYEALRCRDFARVDFKLDGSGAPVFLEINPLPTFAVGRLVCDPRGDAGSQPRRLVGRGPPRGPGAAREVPVSASRADVGTPAWDSWTWQMQHRIRGAADLARFIEPTEDEIQAVSALAERFRFVITPYYASLMDPGDPACPIRRQVVPRMAELDDAAGLADPLDEVAHSPVKNVVRVYPDRIAFCVNNECALYCRYCLRKRMVGDEEWTMKRRELEVALDWIADTPEIRDVLLTGGDPLVFSDDRLDWLLGRLREIPHVEIVRLGTRLPVTLPQRVTPELCEMLARHHPLWLNTHFNHPRELTPEAAAACDRLSRAGIPLGNQSVLLRGVNDDRETMLELCEGLLRIRVRPYYCYQAQLLEGTAHFRVPIERGIALFRSLRGRTSGYAIPQYILDTPDGKVPLDPGWVRGREGDAFVVETWRGNLWREPNPVDSSQPNPVDPGEPNPGDPGERNPRDPGAADDPLPRPDLEGEDPAPE